MRHNVPLDALPPGELRRRLVERTAALIGELPLPTTYRTSPVLPRLRDVESYTGRCGDCEYRNVCGGSRSRAYAVSGDPFGDDPACAHVPAHPVTRSD